MRHLKQSPALTLIPTCLQFSPIAIIAFLLAMALLSLWLYTNGYPYLYDNNESYLSYIHAWYLNYTNPFEFSFLTRESPTTVYIHNPNFPRYIHYALMKLGVLDFTWQLLIITTTTSVSSILLIYYALKNKIQPILLWCILTFFILTPQFVFFSHNTYRVFSFLLFGLMLYSTLKNKPYLTFLSAFMLFQYEYAFAIFLSTSFLTYLLIDGIKVNLKNILAIILGAFISMAVFTGQIITHSSIEYLVNELLNVSLPRRGPIHLGTDIFFAFKFVLNKHGQNIWLKDLICLSIILGSYVSYKLHNILIPKIKLNYAAVLQRMILPSKLLISIFLGGAITTIALSGYCEDGYGYHNLPFVCFHELIIFIFMLSLLSAGCDFFIKLKAKIYCNTFIIILFASTVIVQEIDTYKQYLPLGFTQINRGKYIDVFKRYGNKKYFTNFEVSVIFRPTTPILAYANLAYGLDNIKATLQEYNKNSISGEDSIYYICVQQLKFNCQLTIQELKDEWEVNIIENNKDYAIIEFPSYVYKNIARK